VAFLYPWAVVFRQLGLPGLVAVLAFLVILAVGFSMPGSVAPWSGIKRMEMWRDS
jgi:hypothetical protein